MRIRAADIEDSFPEYNRETINLSGCADRIDCLAAIKDQVLDFVTNALYEFDFPSSIGTQVVTMVGFEKQRLFDKTKLNGVVNISATFKSLSGHNFHMDIPISIRMGEIQKPTVVSINGVKNLLSQEFIDAVTAKVESTRPKLQDLYSGSSMRVFREPVIERPIFSSPLSDAKWYDLINERY